MQTSEGGKYYYNANTKAFEMANKPGESAPRSINKLLENPQVQKAVDKAMRVLGESISK